MPSARVAIGIPGRPDCTVRIGAHLLPTVGHSAASIFPHRARAVLVADAASGALYRPAVKTALVQAGFATTDIALPAVADGGYGTCSVQQAARLWRSLYESGIPAQTLLVALGDLSTCTLGAYVAAGYAGGMPFAAVPTTLEAMAVVATLPTAAVTVGQGPAIATAQPAPGLVCASLDTLVDQGAAAAQAGAAEIVRAGMLGASDEVFQLDDCVDAIAAGREEGLMQGLVLANIVRGDALSKTACATHAAEAGFAYGELLRTGAAACRAADPTMRGRLLADSMRVEARLGVALGITPVELMAEQDALLAALHLDPVADLPAPGDLVDALCAVPGQPEGALRMTLPADAGVFSVVEVDSALVVEHLAARAASLAGER